MRDRSGTLAASNITKSYGAETILDGASLLVRPGARIGVVGPNGSGKTTLLRLLAGLDEPDEGSLERRPPTLTVGHLAQEVDARPDETLLEYLERRTGVGAAATRLDALAARASPTSPRPRRSMPTPSSASSRSAPTTSARAREAAARRARPARPAARETLGGEPRAPSWRRSFSRFDVLSSSTSRRTTSISTASSCWSASWPRRRALVLVSTTGRFSSRRSSGSSSSRQRRGDPRVRRRLVRVRAAPRGRPARRQGSLRAVRGRAGRGSRAPAKAPGRGDDRREDGGPARDPRADVQGALRQQAARAAGGGGEAVVALAPRALARIAAGGEVVARLEEAVVERDGFRLGPIDLELRHGDRLAIAGPNGSGKSTLIAALVGALPLRAAGASSGPASASASSSRTARGSTPSDHWSTSSSTAWSSRPARRERCSRSSRSAAPR